MKLDRWAPDDPVFARKQIEKSIERGEFSREVGEELLRMRYPEREKQDGDAV
jgi:hypothetical protein